jgi:ribonuclease BN (tRNA processing enzyme)
MRRIVSSGTIALIAPAELTGAASVNGSGTSAEIGNVSLSGAHSDVPDVILPGFSFTKGTNVGSSAQATALTVAVKGRLSRHRGVTDTANPTMTKTGTFTVPRDVAPMQGYTFNAGGRIVVSGDTSADAEMLTEIRGCRALGY